MKPLDEVWSRLNGVQALQFQSESRSATGWSGTGNGTVKIAVVSANSLIFVESGEWQQNGGKIIRFSNSFRWSKDGDGLRLEHLRFGFQNPLFLFDMAPDERGVWHEVNSHVCRDDCYRATLELWENRLSLRWEVHGPTRDETIDYTYF